jgi:TrmH RNA methyltransferase
VAVRGRGARRPEQRDEIKVIGLRAAEALVAQRPDDVVRAYLHESLVRPFARALERWAALKIAYHVVDEVTLDRVSGSMHHEGICLLAKPRPPLSEAELLAGVTEDEAPLALLFLDQVDNPNNVGAIVRVAAHYGVPAVLYTATDPRTFSSSAVHRTAEGGAEHVALMEPADPRATLEALRAAGLALIATSGRAAEALHDRPLPARAVFLLGSERDGLTPEVLALADRVVAIEGSGWIESLNVACATTAVLAEWWRTQAEAARAERARAAPRERRPEPRGAGPRAGQPADRRSTREDRGRSTPEARGAGRSGPRGGRPRSR